MQVPPDRYMSEYHFYHTLLHHLNRAIFYLDNCTSNVIDKDKRLTWRRYIHILPIDFTRGTISQTVDLKST